MSAENFGGNHPMFDSPMNDQGLRIKVIGVGMAGSNTVDHLRLNHANEIKLAVVDTDNKTFGSSTLQEKLLIGRSVTRGLSAGGEAEIGRKAAEADREQLTKMVEGFDIIFIVSGLSGGTGSGAATVLAEAAFDSGAIVIAFALLPFSHEGSRRIKQAEETLIHLRGICHAVIPLPNDVLLQEVSEDASVLDAFAVANDWVARGVQGICGMISTNGLINVDFATLRKAFERRGGKTLFGIGFGEGPEYIKQALASLDLCPLLHLPDNKYIRKADTLLVSLMAGTDLPMNAVNSIMEQLTEKFGSKENTILGAVIDSEMKQSLRICVFGTTDVGTTKVYRPTERIERAIAARAQQSHSQPSASIPANKPNIAPSKSPKPGEDQEEFTFSSNEEQRGLFSKTDANLHDGNDLDVPTYLRQGIKIQL
ncbi:MAG: cell division protein FtsZ [Verrucomicrobiota bacterium]|nr:cell division protein FtsZ [Verrucomicrobiota bacterium]